MLACADPWHPLEVAEARWQRAEDIEADQGLQLAHLPSGEPLGYWPRLVIRMDGIDLDNRAWVLSLDDEVLRSLDEEQRGWLVKDQPGIMPLSGGLAAPAALQGQMLRPLYNALKEASEDWEPICRELDLDWPDTLIVVPDARVPWETVRQVLYTAMQAPPFRSYTLAGEHQGRLWGATATKPDPSVPCALSSWMDPRPGQVAVGIHGLPWLRGAGGQCPLADPGEAVETLVALRERCQPRWAVLAEATTGAGSASPHGLPDPEAWRCITVWPYLAGELPAGDALGAMAAVLASAPALELAPPPGGFGGELDLSGCADAVSVAALTQAQLDVMCGGVGLRSWLETWSTPSAPRSAGAYGLSFIGVSGGDDPIWIERATAFPEWAAPKESR